MKKWQEQHEHLTARLKDAEKAATLQQDKDSAPDHEDRAGEL